MAVFSFLARLLLSTLLWPLAACLAWALFHQGAHLPWGQAPLLLFAGGFAAYLLVQMLFWKPLFMYVMGHELTHALAAVLQGGKADDLHVSTQGGQVKVDRNNFLVNLAPYCFPIYTVGVAAVYAVAAEPFKPALVFGLGFTLAFHVALTLYSMRQHQSDISEVGWYFALPFIGCVNALIAALVLALVSPAMGMRAYSAETWAAAKGMAGWVAARM